MISPHLNFYLLGFFTFLYSQIFAPSSYIFPFARHIFHSLKAISYYLKYLCLLLSRLSQINANIRQKCVQEELARVYANDSDARRLYCIKAKNQIFINEAKWDEIRKFKSKGDNEHGT